MGFLARLGSVILKFTAIASGFAPMIAAAVPQASGAVTLVVSELQQIASIVQQAEVFGQALQLPGAQKLTGAAPSVAQLILQSALLANHKIADPVKFQAGVTQITAGMADVLSSLDDKVQITDKT
jgi:hypothetical protein